MTQKVKKGWVSRQLANAKKDMDEIPVWLRPKTESGMFIASSTSRTGVNPKNKFKAKLASKVVKG